ncbi:hypothetical protein FACS189460_5390 [Deltaproteobacteria bacterium]|nr:hypothetical protein FACS189460_5390 [Deltaproteobacteria bacterium]
MESRDKELLARLAGENPELAALVNEHKSLESRLEEMNNRPFLAPEEDLERKKIQKAKLAVKDRIQEFLDRVPR